MNRVTTFIKCISDAGNKITIKFSRDPLEIKKFKINQRVSDFTQREPNAPTVNPTVIHHELGAVTVAWIREAWD